MEMPMHLEQTVICSSKRGRFGNCCIWPSSRAVTGIKVPTCCSSLSAVPLHWAATACRAVQWLPRKAVRTKIQITGYIYIFFTNRGEVKGTWLFFSCSWKALLASNIYARLAPEMQWCRVPLVLGAEQADKAWQLLLAWYSWYFYSDFQGPYQTLPSLAFCNHSFSIIA